MTMPTRPVLRYHGGKWMLAPWLLGFYPEHRVYVEPFGGGASVLMRKSPSYAEVYNDLDSEVVNVFRMMRDRGDELRRQLFYTPFSNAEFRDSFFRSDDPLEQARRTIARSFMGFGSASVTEYKHSSRIGKPTTGFRANSSRSGTTPAHDWANYYEAAEAMIARLRGVVIENRDAMEVISRHDSVETLFYVDPPYVASTRDRGNDYAYEMDEGQHRALAACLHAIQGMVVLSGYASELYDAHLYADWSRYERPAFADGARPRTEVVWLNSACASALNSQQAQGSMFA